MYGRAKFHLGLNRAAKTLDAKHVQKHVPPEPWNKFHLLNLPLQTWSQQRPVGGTEALRGSLHLVPVRIL